MKSKITNWLKKTLGITKIEEENKYLRTQVEFLQETHIKDLERISSLNNTIDKHNVQIGNLLSLVEIGVDVNIERKRGRGWAVICLNGKSDYVKFVDLAEKDIRGIRDFISSYEGTKKTIDAPPFIYSKKNL